MIHILHLHTELNLACGITRTISQIINNSSSEFEHHLIALGGDGLNRFEAFNFNPIVLSLDRFSLIGALKIYFFLLNYCKKYSIQIIHSHHRSFDTITWLLKPFLKVKSITSVQSKVYGKKKFSYKADKLIACSSNIKNHLIKNFVIDNKRIIVIYNAVNSNIEIKKEQLGDKTGIEFDEYVIGFIGRIDFVEKGLDVLLNAFNEVIKLNPKIHLLIIGDGINSLQAEEFCLQNKSKATLISSKENIFNYYNLIDLVILPSRVDPFPLTMLEVGLMNLPFIGSNVDGISEFIENGKDGLLFESGNVEELINQIFKVYNDREWGNKLASNLHKKVLESYTVDKIIPQYEKLYRELLIG